MHGEGHQRRERGQKKLAAIPRDFWGRSEQRSRGRGAESDDDCGLYRRDLVIEPQSAREYLFAVRPFVNPSLAARLPLEMLDRVGQINLCRIETGFRQRVAQQLPGWTHEWLAGEVLLISGLLADQHQPRIRRTLAEHRLGGALPKVAPPASSSGFAKCGQRTRFRHDAPRAAARSPPKGRIPSRRASRWDGVTAVVSHGSGGVLAGGRRRLVACSKRYARPISCGSLNARPKKVTPDGKRFSIVCTMI